MALQSCMQNASFVHSKEMFLTHKGMCQEESASAVNWLFELVSFCWKSRRWREFVCLPGPRFCVPSFPFSDVKCCMEQFFVLLSAFACAIIVL